MRIAINGFGRIGRTFLRTILLDKKALTTLEIAVINIGPANPEKIAHMFTYDTIMGKFPGSVRMESNTLIIDEIIKIAIIAQTDSAQLNWKKYNIDWVVDASGQYTKREDSEKHIEAGAKYVLISAPAKNEDISIIPGVNETTFNPQKDHIVSLGSCTTNALVTTLYTFHQAFGIEECFITTIHAYTNSQVLLDVEDHDLRRARAAALNIIPTTTGASKMLIKILPELDNKVSALAIRVPVAVVSLLDISFIAKKPVSKETINDAFLKASQNQMKGIMGFSTEPLVSSDFIGSSFSVAIDGLLTKTVGSLAKVFGWYDNEWGYSMRLKDFLLYANTKTQG